MTKGEDVMKRTLFLITVFILCIVTMLPFSVLAEPDNTSSDNTGSTDEVLCEHLWEDDTDGTSGQHCSICLMDYCEVNGHTEGTPASCTKMAVCSVCDEEFGEMLEHEYIETNDCSARITCNNCGELIKAAGKHDWTPASCTAAKTCNTCGMVQGDKLLHRWDEGTVIKQATSTQNGTIKFECLDCHEEKTQNIYFNEENSNGEKDITLPIIICAVAILIVVGIVTLVTILRRRKSK